MIKITNISVSSVVLFKIFIIKSFSVKTLTVISNLLKNLFSEQCQPIIHIKQYAYFL